MRCRTLVWSVAMALPSIGVAGVPEQHASVLDSLRTWTDDGRYAIVDSVGSDELVHVEAQFGSSSIEVARVIDELVHARISSQATEEATLSLAERAVELRERAMDWPLEARARSLKQLGVVLMIRQDFEGARSALDRALTLYDASKGSTSVEVGSTLSTLGSLFNEAGHQVEARRLLRRSLDISEAALGRGHKDLAGKYYNFARLLVRMGEYEEADRVYQETRDIIAAHHGTRHTLMAYVANGQGILCDEMGDYPRARLFYDEAISIAEETLGPESAFAASCYLNLGYLHRNLGAYTEAEALYERALRAYRVAEMIDHSLTATALRNLAEVYQLQGQTERAKQMHVQALEMRRRVLGEEHPQVALSLDELGTLHAEMGDLSKAQTFHERALEIRRRAQGENHPDVAISLGGLAQVSAKRGDYDRTVALLTEAMDIRVRSLGEDHVLLAETANDLAEAHLKRGESGPALDLALRAEAISRESTRLSAGYLPERLALRLAATRETGLGLALRIVEAESGSDALRSVWDSIVRSRALVLDEMALRHRVVHRNDDPQIAELRQEFDRASRRLANLLVRSGYDAPERHGEKLDRAREERERLEFALAEKSHSFREQLARERIDLDAVAAAIPRGSVLVAFYSAKGVDGRNTYAFVTRSNEKVGLRILGPTAEIEDAVFTWRREIGAVALGPASDLAASEARTREAGDRLHRLVWEPIASAIGDATSIFVVPDGALHLLNLYALPAGEGYVVDQNVVIHLLSTERDLIDVGGEARGNGLFLVGGVDFGTPQRSSDLASTPPGRVPDCGSLRDITFEPLPGTEGEVAAISEMWGEVDHDLGQSLVQLTGSAAGERDVKSGISGHRIVHFSTHGFVLDGSCVESARGVRGIGGVSPKRPRTGANPLQLAGLALAGANMREFAGAESDDGILTAEEIAALDLHGTDWVVLSGCETGVGGVEAGEGVLGLRRAFQVAGSRALIMSLWPVEDASTQAWMKHLYEARIRDGRDTADAVRTACLRTLTEMRHRGGSTHPFYWAAFVAAEVWR